MAKKYLDNNGLLYLWSKIKATFVADLGYDSSTHQITKTKNGSVSNIVSVPYKVSDLTNDSGFLTSETDPTVPSWAKASSKPTYTANEVGALPSTTVIPSKTSDLTNDSGFLTSADIPEGASASTTTPKMDGTANKGSETAFARGDHVHPSDTTRVPNTRKINNKALSSDVTLNGEDLKVSSSDNATISDSISDLWLAVDIPLATTSAKGLMSNTDKTKLDSITVTNGVIDSSNLPSFVDDVIEAYVRSGQTELGSTWLATGSASGTVITPETGKIYVLMNSSTTYDTNTQFRWGGTAYVKLSDGGVSAITNAEIDTIVAS